MSERRGLCFRIKKEETREDVLNQLPEIFTLQIKRFLASEKKENVVINWRTLKMTQKDDSGDRVYTMEVFLSEGKVPDPLEYSHKL